MISKFFFEAGGTKARDNKSAFSIDICGSKDICNESLGEGAMVAKLATNIKNAIEVSIDVKPCLSDICKRLVFFDSMSVQQEAQV